MRPAGCGGGDRTKGDAAMTLAYDHDHVRIHHGDALEQLREMPDESAHCCVTSPPYYALRDYGVEGQLGLEETPEAFVAVMAEVFREVRRVLRPDGTLWLNFGDSYASRPKRRTEAQATAKSGLAGGLSTQCQMLEQPNKVVGGYKNKDLMGMPWRVAFALQADGWWLRQDIIWHKPTPMPESVRDRCTRAHEYIFLLSKSAKYHYDSDAIREPSTYTGRRAFPDGWEAGSGNHDAVRRSKKKRGHERRHQGLEAQDSLPRAQQSANGRNKRSVWTVVSKGYPDAHFATFPPELIEPCILAGCPEGGIVLDPFGGSGTTAQVARELGRKAVLIELNADYIELAKDRLKQCLMF